MRRAKPKPGLFRRQARRPEPRARSIIAACAVGSIAGVAAALALVAASPAPWVGSWVGLIAIDAAAAEEAAFAK